MPPPTEKERLDAVEPVVEQVVADHADLAAEVVRLTARIAVLERRLAGVGAAEPAALDATADGVGPLVETLHLAWDAEQEVLADVVRAELRQQVADHEQARIKLAETQAALAGGRVSRAERDLLAHDLHQWEWQVSSGERGAVEAAERLAADARAGEDTWRRDAVRAGEKARAELHDQARELVLRALAEDRRLPVWFTVALPPITAPDPTPWLAAATDLVAYRLEYRVTDPLRPLGEPPSPSSGSAAWVRRTEAAAAITDQLVALRP